MRKTALSSIAIVFVAAGCVAKEATAPVALESFPVRATITPDNRCSVEALGKTYSSVGQVRGATLPAFVGTLENAGYHAVGCWVSAPDGSDGDLIVLFAGDSYQKQFETGTFQPRFEPPYGVSQKFASVSFTASTLSDERLATIDQSSGNIVVDSNSSGARTVRVDVSAIKYQY